MADRLTDKTAHVRAILSRAAAGELLSEDEMEREIRSLWEWILFFQHERLVHLLIMILFALLTFGSFALFLITSFLPVIALFVLFLVLLIPYIFYYYHLENGVQNLYGLYDHMKTVRRNSHG